MDNVFSEINALGIYLGIGEVKGEIKPITGGLLHKMYDVKTDSGRFAVKALNPTIMRRPKALGHTIFSEKTANIARENGINLVCGKWFKGEVVHEIQGRYFMIFDFLEGKILKQEEIKPAHCALIGEILAKLHSTDFSELVIDENENNLDFKNEKFIDWDFYLNKGKDAKAIWTDLLELNLGNLYSWTKKLHECEKESGKNLVISHRDMDSKNVMWKEDIPYIIDWESSGLINPHCDLFETALYWSKEENEIVNKNKFLNVINSYSKIMPIKNVNWNVVFGSGYSGVEWLEYSLKRSLALEISSEDEQKLGTSQVISTINGLVKFDAQYYELNQLCKNLI